MKAKARVSSDSQVSLPAAICIEAGIYPGTELEVLVTERGVRLVPVQPLAELRGIARRDDTVPIRDEDERF